MKTTFAILLALLWGACVHVFAQGILDRQPEYSILTAYTIGAVFVSFIFATLTLLKA